MIFYCSFYLRNYNEYLSRNIRSAKPREKEGVYGHTLAWEESYNKKWIKSDNRKEKKGIE